MNICRCIKKSIAVQIQYSIYTVQYIYTIQYSIYTVHYTVLYTVYSIYTVQYIYSTVYIQYSIYTEQYIYSTSDAVALPLQIFPPVSLFVISLSVITNLFYLLDWFGKNNEHIFLLYLL